MAVWSRTGGHTDKSQPGRGLFRANAGSGKVAAGAGVYAISAITGFRLDTLEDYLKPRKTITVSMTLVL